MSPMKLLSSTATEVAEVIRNERGQPFKADWHGATDEFDSQGSADVVWINDGRGFQPGVQVVHEDFGTMYYVGPFKIEQMPTRERMFIFHCAGAMLVRGPKMGPPPR